jgi:hypothetical protein
MFAPSYAILSLLFFRQVNCFKLINDFVIGRYLMSVVWLDKEWIVVSVVVDYIYISNVTRFRIFNKYKNCLFSFSNQPTEHCDCALTLLHLLYEYPLYHGKMTQKSWHSIQKITHDKHITLKWLHKLGYNINKLHSTIIFIASSHFSPNKHKPSLNYLISVIYQLHFCTWTQYQTL